MASLDSLWSRFMLDDKEEQGVQAPQPVEEIAHRLAGCFFTKRTLNVDLVARTFKPLWTPVRELKIRDIGDNILLFEFEDNLDLECVLEFEPWTFDKHIMAPWWRKSGSKGALASPQASGMNTSTSSESELMREVIIEESRAANLSNMDVSGVSEAVDRSGYSDSGGTNSLTKSIQGLCMDKFMANASLMDFNIVPKASDVVDLTQPCTIS
nr:hypothetical protein CFP56_18781 [Quercus suber]